MTLVSARGRHRDGSRRAFLFAANRTAHASRNVLELRVPATQLREQVRRRAPLSKARPTGQYERVLTEFIGQLFDMKAPLHAGHCT